jgi:hypothetical protein
VRLGFVKGNTLQALVFASPHLLIFVVPRSLRASALNLGFVLVVATVGGWGLGFVNEWVRNGRSRRVGGLMGSGKCRDLPGGCALLTIAWASRSLRRPQRLRRRQIVDSQKSTILLGEN